MSQPDAESHDTEKQRTRRTILKAMGATSATTVSGSVMSASADDAEDEDARPDQDPAVQELVSEYENSPKVNTAIEANESFIAHLFDEIDVSKTVNDLMVDDVASPERNSPEGVLVRAERTGDEPTVKLNVVRNTDIGPVNLALYPESDIDPYATVTVEDRDQIHVYRREYDEADNSHTFTVSVDTFGGGLSTLSHNDVMCPRCPTDTTCCRCLHDCLNDCCEYNLSCTPVYDYYCDCCRYSRPSCWADCY